MEKLAQDNLGKLLCFLDKLNEGKIFYSLTSIRPEAVMVQVVVPGERWEVEFLTNGIVEIERFKSDGEIFDEGSLKELFEKYAEPQN